MKNSVFNPFYLVQLDGESCSWSGQDCTSNDPVNKSVTINFYDGDTAMQFYDSCEVCAEFQLKQIKKKYCKK